MKVIYDVQSDECLAFAEGVERELRKLPSMEPSEIVPRMESMLKHIRTCQELGISDLTLVGYLNTLGALIVKQLEHMGMV